MGLRITTWNVNGIRNPFSYQPWRDKRSYVAMFDTLEADIVALQETKIQRKDLQDDMVLVPGWDCYFSLPKHEKGKFGVVIYTRQSVCAPIRAEEGITGILCPPNSSTSYRDLPEDQQIGGYPTVSQALNAPEASDISMDFTTLDSEGRCVILEFPAFVMIGVYCPASRDDSRTAFRISFLNLLDARVRNLVDMGKRVILTGDLNIILSPLDMANCETELRKSGTTVDVYFSRPARRLLNHLVEDGDIYGDRDEGRETGVMHDICRVGQPNRKGMFTCWETKINARPGNYGARIDYVLCSLDMKDWFSDSNIQEGLLGSDHCPVYATIEDKIQLHGATVHTLDFMNPPGMFKDGKRLREYSTKDMLPLSGKLIAEFNGRRSIKDMFATKPSVSKEERTLITDGIHEALPAVPQIPEPGTPEPKADDESLFLSPETPRVAKPSRTMQSPLASNKRTLERSVNKPTKRKKVRSAPKLIPMQAKGQQSLVGFFKPKLKTQQKNEAPTDTQGMVLLPTRNFSQTTPQSECAYNSSYPQSLSTPVLSHSSLHPDLSPSVTSSTASEFPVHDPIASAESWSKLFTKPNAPLCESHQEPCKTMTTKKPGPNCGRSFWMCSKPLGPSGQKEKGTQWRCGTFIWCSDWNAS